MRRGLATRGMVQQLGGEKESATNALGNMPQEKVTRISIIYISTVG